jgi:hypothetical protein
MIYTVASGNKAIVAASRFYAEVAQILRRAHLSHLRCGDLHCTRLGPARYSAASQPTCFALSARHFRPGLILHTTTIDFAM